MIAKDTRVHNVASRQNTYAIVGVELDDYTGFTRLSDGRTAKQALARWQKVQQRDAPHVEYTVAAVYQVYPADVYRKTGFIRMKLELLA